MDSLTSLPPPKDLSSIPEKRMSSAGLLFVGAVGYPVIAILGTGAAVVSLVKTVWAYSHLFLIHRKLTTQISSKQIIPLTHPEKTMPLAIQEEQTEREAKTAAHQLVASIFALVPFLGIFAAGAYLKGYHPHIKETGVQGAVKALSENVLTGQLELVRKIFYPLTGKSPQQLDAYKMETCAAKQKQIQEAGGRRIEIPVDRGDDKTHHLDGYFFRHPDHRPGDPTVVLFHANGQTALDSLNWIKLYKHQRFNVLAVTMGGYPESDPSITTSEISTYQDVNGIILHLKEQNKREEHDLQLILHGTSIGGSLAFAGADLHPDVVKVVVANQTFSCAQDVAVNVVKNSTKPFGADKFIPTSLIRGAVGSAFPLAQVVPGVQAADGTPYKTDGLDNVEKAKRIKAQLFAIESSQDTFMGRDGAPIGSETVFQNNFAQDLLKTRYPEEEMAPPLITFQGTHCSFLEEPAKSDLLDPLLKLFEMPTIP